MRNPLTARLSSVRNRARQVAALVRRWSLGSQAKEQLAHWQEMERTGSALEALLASPAWEVLQEAKGFYQGRADVVLRDHRQPETARLKAAVEWQTLEAFFAEIRHRVRNGQVAREALRKVTP